MSKPSPPKSEDLPVGIGPTPPTYVLTADAAAILHLSPRTLERRRVDGTGPPFICVGRRILYDLAKLHAWAAAQTYQNTAERDLARREARRDD